MDKAKITFKKSDNQRKSKTLVNILIGAAAGSVATIVGRPLEVIEQNITTQGRFYKKQSEIMLL